MTARAGAWTTGQELSVTGTVALADEAPAAEDVVAGWAGFLVIAALVIATGFLIRSMSKRLRRIDFDEGPEPDQRSQGAGPTTSSDGPDDGPDDGPGPDPDNRGDAGPRPG